MRSGRSAGLLGLVVAVLVAVVASCTATSADKGATAVCDAPGVTPDKVNLGMVLSDTGVGSATFSSARSGAAARIGLANAEGGVHGRTISYEWHDDASSPSQNARVTEDLVRGGDVLGLMLVSTGVGDSLQALAAEKVPVVGLGLPSWSRFPNMFSNMYEASPVTVGQYVRASGGRKVGIVATGTSAAVTENLGRYRAAFESVGLALTDTIPFASTDNPSGVVQQLAVAGADSLVSFTTPDDLARIVQAAQAANLGLAPTVSFAGYDQSLLPVLGTALAGVSFPVYTRPFEAGGTALDRYRTAMARFAPEVVHPDQQFALQAYIYTDMFLRGLELAGACPTRDGFIQALRKVSDYDAGGLIEPVNLSTNPTQPLSCYAFVRINAGGTDFEVNRQHVCADGTSS